MAEVIDRMGGRVAVVGHDWGAVVAYGLAITAPERVSRLVVANGVHPLAFQRALDEGGAQAEASRYIDWLRREGSEEPLAADGYARLWRMFGDLPGALGPGRRSAYEAAWGGAEGLRSMVDWYRAAPIRVPVPGERRPPDGRDPERFRVSMPHLVLWGMRDTAFIPEMRHGAEPFSDAFDLEEFTEADHWLLHREPDRAAGRIAAFLG
jgi:pimeloyl-ACP methyl ester carboxylesterase